MNIEIERLATFADWPSDTLVSPASIAKAGFYSTRQGLTVECFSCHLQISDWDRDYGSVIMARHRALSPNCAFVIDPTTSGNVPITAAQPSSAPSSSVISSTTNMLSESARLQTFENWPVSHIVTPESLASAGFFYLNQGDTTKCAYCKGTVRAWEVGDNPDSEHRRHFPNCPFVITTIIPRLRNTSNSDSLYKKSLSNLTVLSRDDDLDQLGVHEHKGPNKMEYATVESRLKTFSSWPAELIQTPDVLAQAGFYYEGLGDQVRCFHCDGGLRHWDPHDDPWTEHARWFPRCPFVKLVKGQEFVTACALENNVGSNLEEVRQKNNKPSTTSRRREVSEREIQEQLSSPTALAALSIGLNVERVKRAIRQKLEQTGRGYSQPDALVEAALNLQHEEEEDLPTEPETSPLSNTIRNVLTSIVGDSMDNVDTQVSTVKLKPDTPKEVCQSLDEEITLNNAKVVKTVSLEEEVRQLKEARLCKICMDVEVGIVFLPCGHLATCGNCAPNLEDCPVCRSVIKATVRTFLS